MTKVEKLLEEYREAMKAVANLESMLKAEAVNGKGGRVEAVFYANENVVGIHVYQNGGEIDYMGGLSLAQAKLVIEALSKLFEEDV